MQSTTASDQVGKYPGILLDVKPVIPRFLIVAQRPIRLLRGATLMSPGVQKFSVQLATALIARAIPDTADFPSEPKIGVIH